MEEKFRLDRSAFKATNAADADNHVKYWQERSYRERLEAAYYLVIRAYGISADTPLDKSAFSKRKR